MSKTDKKKSKKHNHLAAEMRAEQNYNQIDGVINNYKPSILEYLKQNKPTPPERGGKANSFIDCVFDAELIEHPPVTQLSTISKMKSHLDYTAAKSGDVDAAFRLIKDLLCNKEHKRKIYELGQKYAGAILVGVHTVERAGINKIPHALVIAISKITGIEYNFDIVQLNSVGRTGSDAIYRLAHRPKFDGTICAGRKYILVDDVITGGGTFSEMRCYIESKGGKVEHLVVAGASQFSTNIALSEKTRCELESKYDMILLKELLKGCDIYNGKVEYLTESEGRTILGAGSLINLRDRIVKARYEGSIQKTRRTLENGVR